MTWWKKFEFREALGFLFVGRHHIKWLMYVIVVAHFLDEGDFIQTELKFLLFQCSDKSSYIRENSILVASTKRLDLRLSNLLIATSPAL